MKKYARTKFEKLILKNYCEICIILFVYYSINFLQNTILKIIKNKYIKKIKWKSEKNL